MDMSKKTKNSSDSANLWLDVAESWWLASQGETMQHIHPVGAIITRGKKHSEKETWGEGRRRCSGKVWGVGFVHCFLVCSSSSRHPSSLLRPEHRGYLAPGPCCQRLETQGSADFPNHCFTVPPFRKKFLYCTQSTGVKLSLGRHAQTLLMANMMGEWTARFFSSFFLWMICCTIYLNKKIKIKYS